MTLDRLLLSVYDRLSNQMAGGRRMPAQELLPGADDPYEGTVADPFLPEVNPYDWYDPILFSGPSDDFDLSQVPIPPTGKGRDGDGADFFRGGEAPNNYANRHHPLYQARRDFAVAIAPKIEQMFGVSAQGSAGYYRPPHPSHAEPGGPSANSDHYSAGAIDFFGDPAKLDALRDWLVAQPWTSFVRWRSESHHDHVHLSIDLNWIAQNYYQGRTLPLPAVAPSRASAAPENARMSPGRLPPPTQVSQDPTANRVM